MNVKGENGKHHHDHTADRWAEFMSDWEQFARENQDMINGLRIDDNTMRKAINTHAEIMGLHRWLLEKFIPAPVLEAAVNEYSKMRAAQIEEERLKAEQEANLPVMDGTATPDGPVN
jgi:hypothetical protein